MSFYLANKIKTIKVTMFKLKFLIFLSFYDYFYLIINKMHDLKQRYCV